MKIIRLLLFIPLCFAVISLIYWLFGLLLGWVMGLSLFWLIVLLLFFGGTIWMLFTSLAGLMMLGAAMISPSKKFSFWTVLVLAILNGISVIYDVWTLDINYRGADIFGAIVFTILVAELSLALIIGAGTAMEEDY